jgi:putative oxidoreductase
MKSLTLITDLTARVMIGVLFLMAGINKIPGYEGTQGYMEAMGVEPSLLPLVILLEIIGAIFIIVGFRTRITAFLLAGFSVLAALLFHANFNDQIQSILFMKNIAIAGGLLFITNYGASSLSIDALLNTKKVSS